MRRMILVVVVAAVLVAMAATPAFAGSQAGTSGGGDCRAGCVNTNNVGDGHKGGGPKGGHKGGGGPGGDAGVSGGTKIGGSTGDD